MVVGGFRGGVLVLGESSNPGRDSGNIFRLAANNKNLKPGLIMKPRTIAIGDIHGHLKALQGLLACIKPTFQDTLIFLGDYVDRGPDSRGVLDWILGLSKDCKVIPIRGNHEDMMLEAIQHSGKLQAWLDNGGDMALRSYGGKECLDRIPGTHIQFLHSLPLFYEMEDHVFIHASYVPGWRFGDHDSNTALWMPLVEIPAPHYSGKTVVLGHTPQMSGRILNYGHVVCIDTGCGFGGCLTGLEIHSGQYWQVNEQGVEV